MITYTLYIRRRFRYLSLAATREPRIVHYHPARLGCGCITAGRFIMPVIHAPMMGWNTSYPFSDSSGQSATQRMAQNYRAITSAMVLETLPDPQYITFYRIMQSSRPFERSDFIPWIGSAVVPSAYAADTSSMHPRCRARCATPCYSTPPFSPSNRLHMLTSGAQKRFYWRKVSVSPLIPSAQA